MPPKHAPPEDHSPKIPNTARHFLPQPNSPNPPDSSPPEPAPSSTWACTTCDKAMKFVHRASHLLSNSHIRTARSRTPFTDLPLQQSTWRCVECGDCMPLSHRIGHLANKHDTPNTLPTQSPASAFADISRTANQLYELSTSNIFPSHTAQLDQGQREHLGEENDRCVYCSHIALHGHQCGIMQCELCGVWLSRRYEFVHQFTARHRHAVAQVTWEREQQEVLGRVPEDCPSPAVEGGDSTNDNPLEMATRDIDLAMETEYIPSRGLGGCPHCIALVQGGRYHHLECEAVNHCSRCGCATCYAQSSKSDPTGDTTWTDEKRWTCTLCSRTMRIGSREGHEALATHRARVQPRLRQVHGRGKPLPRKKSKPGNEKWQCEVCERTLRVNERDNHLASRKHQRKEGLAQLPDKTKVTAGLPLGDGDNADGSIGKATSKKTTTRRRSCS